MPLIAAFEFTLNTDVNTFCTWLEDRSARWQYSYTADRGRVVDIQKTILRKAYSRTICSFDAVIEILDDNEFKDEQGRKGWDDPEEHLFDDRKLRKGILRRGVISLVVSPAPRAGKVDVRSICMDERAVDGFAHVLRQIAKAYPESDAPIRKLTEEQFPTDPSLPTVEMPTGKRRRASNASYDKAYESIKSGMSLHEAYNVYKQTAEYADKTLENNFRRAMNRRTQKDTNE